MICIWVQFNSALKSLIWIHSTLAPSLLPLQYGKYIHSSVTSPLSSPDSWGEGGQRDPTTAEKLYFKWMSCHQLPMYPSAALQEEICIFFFSLMEIHIGWRFCFVHLKILLCPFAWGISKFVIGRNDLLDLGNSEEFRWHVCHYHPCEEFRVEIASRIVACKN